MSADTLAINYFCFSVPKKQQYPTAKRKVARRSIFARLDPKQKKIIGCEAVLANHVQKSRHISVPTNICQIFFQFFQFNMGITLTQLVFDFSSSR